MMAGSGVERLIRKERGLSDVVRLLGSKNDWNGETCMVDMALFPTIFPV